MLGIAAASALTLAGCAGGETTDAAGTDDAVTVVASTNVYGDIAEQIAGGLVEVTSIIESAAMDPHEFEASAADQLTVSNADLIIENGGGYDSFMDSMIESTGTEAHVITAAEFSHDWPGSESEGEHDHADEESEDDHDHDHIEGFNEHVWYDPHTIEHVAEAIAEELGELQPEDADTFVANAEAFVAEIAGLEEDLDAIAAAHGGEGVFATEPVGFYLLEAAGLTNLTPDAFSEAVEEGQDVPPATLLEALTILQSGDVALVVANSQTGGAETNQVIDEADAEDIPVVEFTETLPDGQTYISWMQTNVDAVSAALGE
ncbi:metal ABC transporter substrate-binding protein [Microbacterium thalassium]|nr:metal ABC transporter substrate-binding protein [Microbacterium thalassium]